MALGHPNRTSDGPFVMTHTPLQHPCSAPASLCTPLLPAASPPAPRLVGPCVLGGLRPRVLLVTTPNWEYNGVLRACELVAVEAAARRNKAGSTAPALTPGGAWPGPPGRDGLPLRCADHRFEWTRAEFRGWCEQLADQWDGRIRHR